MVVLLYHAVVREAPGVPDWLFLSAESFQRQMEYLKRHCDVLALLEAVERLRGGDRSRPCVAITFDDGFQNNYDVALPILRAAGLPATVFLATEFVGTSDTPWFCRLSVALGETTKAELEWDGQRFNLSDPVSRRKASSAIRTRVKRFPQPRLLAEVRRIVEALGDDPDRPVESGSPFRMLSRASVAEMAASSLIDFGGHTRSHAILSQLTVEEQRTEIEGCLTDLENVTGRRCRVFAYPNGRMVDFDETTTRLLSAHGVSVALTAIDGVNDETTPVMALRRCAIGTGTRMVSFRTRVRRPGPVGWLRAMLGSG